VAPSEGVTGDARPSADPVILALAARFATAAPPVAAAPFGGGHVNTTYRVTDATGRAYLLQRISRTAFRRPADVMANIVTVTAHLAAKARSPRDHLTLVPTLDGGFWTEAEGETWRLYDFVADSVELGADATTADLRRAGEAFGRFLADVADLPAERLHVTIPDFHNWPRYVARLKQVAAADPLGRRREVGPELEQALSYEDVSHAFDDPDLMPQRVTHNDAKLANVLFDRLTRAPLCVVDLDTVQPGLAVNDFGDSIRSGATSAPEDEGDVTRVHFVPERFAAYAGGFLAAAGPILTASELAHLRHGALLMTLETSLRFLTDYLEGDVYYATDRPGQNLDRARNQLALLADIQAHWNWMAETLATL
jgi:Ser/Thr protein kinase RdoA (MazF antagonist)